MCAYTDNLVACLFAYHAKYLQVWCRDECLQRHYVTVLYVPYFAYVVIFFPVGPLCPVSTVSTNPFVNYTFREDDTGELSLQLKENSPIQQSRVFNDGEVAVVKSEVESDNSRILVTIDPVMPHHEGVVQVEVENRASIFTEYYRVHVQRESHTSTHTHTHTHTHTYTHTRTHAHTHTHIHTHMVVIKLVIESNTG